MKMNCPNCGNPCEVLKDDGSGRKVCYCDPAVIHDGKPGCDFSFEITKGKAKQSDDAKGFFVKITEELTYQEKRIADLEQLINGKSKPSKPLFPWTV